MSKCIGCGVKLQNIDRDIIGFTSNIDNVLCERCFRIRNYNEYKTVTKSNQDYIDILSDINKTDDLIVLVIDLFNIPKELNDISKYINNNILLVLTKRDLLPLSCYDEKFKNYFNNYNLNIVDKVIISSNKNYNFDPLFDKINKYKNSNRVYVVGFTNSGKSTMINKIIYNYSSMDTLITTSNLPSTTIDSIEVKVNDELTLIDTPGLLDSGDIINYIDKNEMKKIIPQKEIKPITYQIKDKQSIIIEDLLRIDLSDMNSLTLYMSNKLDIKRIYKDTLELKNLEKHKLDIQDDCDVVVQGLGFIKFTKKATITLYARKGVSAFVRKNLI